MMQHRQATARWDHIVRQLVSLSLLVGVLGLLLVGGAATGAGAAGSRTSSTAPFFTVYDPPTTATVGKPYSFTFEAAGNPTPTFALKDAPGWLSINSTTGEVLGTPPSDGPKPFTFSYDVVATNGVTPPATVGPFTVTTYTLPATPIDVTATSGVYSARLHWVEPTTGGAPNRYVIFVVGAGALRTITGGTVSSVTLGGLMDGVAYTFTVTAANPGGGSDTSAPSDTVLPTSVAPVGTTTGSGTNPSASAKNTRNTISVTSTGSGALTVATYPSAPVAASTYGPTFATTYFDVHTAPTSSFNDVNVTVCGIRSGQSLLWWNPTVHAWRTVSPQTGLNAGCVTANLANASSPTVAMLYGAIFASSRRTTFQTTQPKPPPPPAKTAGYDMVGSDGGVFVFSPPGTTGGFFGSLPGLTPPVHVNNIVGMVPTASDQGYFLVGSDGGVFAFGNAPFLGSLPGLHVTPSQPITGLVPTGTDGGYFLVGKDGGVFAFGNATFAGSLPQIGVHRSDIIGIAATPSGSGYWLVAADGTVYGFGASQTLGSATGSASPVTAIAGTPDGGGYWIVTANGTVHAFGDAQNFGTLPALGVTPALAVIGIVHTADTKGYWLIGSDGGIFAFGDAGFVGSLPGLNVHVTNVVGAVPTVS
jgi:hypothetical protein